MNEVHDWNRLRLQKNIEETHKLSVSNIEETHKISQKDINKDGALLMRPFYLFPFLMGNESSNLV